jgi:hypothetical protein
MQGPTDRPPWYGTTPGSDDVVRGAIETRNKKKKRTAKAKSAKVQHQCCYCGDLCDTEILEIEHICPFSEIGRQATNMSELQMIANDTANLAYACGTKSKGCNQSKSDKPLFTFLEKDQTEYDGFLKEYSEFSWMDTTGSGSMTYAPPWQPRALTGEQTDSDAAYAAKLKKLESHRLTDYRPRPPIGWEECYFNLNGACIGPVGSVEDCCKRAGVALKDVLDTSSDRYAKGASDKDIRQKSAAIQEICWQTMK